MAGQGLRMRRAPAIGMLVALVVVAALVACALVSGGYDARKVQSKSTSVWVIRGSGQYGRVDTALGELDTVKDADSPHAVAQSGSKGVVYTDGYQKRWSINASDPKDLVASSDTGASTSEKASEKRSTDGSASSGTGSSASAGGNATPAGTRQVFTSGKWTVYLTDSGSVFVQDLTATGSAGEPVQVPSPAKHSSTVKGKNGATNGYSATAVAVSDDGMLALYSGKDHVVRRFSAKTNTFSGDTTTVGNAPSAGSKTLLTLVGTTWVLADTAHDRVWLSGHSGAIRAPLKSGAVAENGTAHGDTAYFSDSRGLVAVDLNAATAKRSVRSEGTPATPTSVDGTVYAAWLGQQRGTLWSDARKQTKSLEVPNGVLGETSGIAPVIASNGSSAVLNETASGMLWRIPSGTVIPLSQWKAQKNQQTKEQGVKVATVTQEEPPVAQSSSFGVRAGKQSLLPVLLNAYDPNKKDVLTILPGSVSSLSQQGFGTLSLTDDDQQLIVDVNAQSGSATFTYMVTDGSEHSDPATVTLHVVPDKQDSAPEWCGIDNCMQTWPTAELVPGGTTVVPVMNAWVDPDGDPMVLESAVKDDPKAPIVVVPTSDGSVAIRHTDANAGGGTYAVTVTVVDSDGKSATKNLTVTVSSDASIEVEQSAVVASVGQRRTITVDDYVRGGSGSYRLVDAVAASNQQNHVSVVPSAAAGTVTLSADAAGQYVVALTVQDTQTHVEESGQIRLSVASTAQRLTIPPLTAFVQQDSDTTIDVLDAAENTSGHILALTSVSTDSARLSADVVEHERLRLAGSTANGSPGLVGSATITIADSSGATATGTVAVFLAPRSTGVPPIAIPDAVTVRAGHQVDIPVTDNDIVPRGQQLTLSPTLATTSAPGQLAFVSGDKVRYLAPSKAGTYTVRYSIYFAADPTQVSTAAVTITVVGNGQNHAPNPAALSARVTAGSSVPISVPSTGMDPDGDTTTLSAVDQPKRGQGSATISADGSSIEYTAPASGVDGGQATFDYRVSDGHGETGTGTVTIAVLASTKTYAAPIAYTDTVHAIVGSSNAITVEPLRNDIDPAGGSLKLISLVPNAPKKTGDSEYNRLKKLIDGGTRLSAGTVKLRAGDIQGTQSYVYTVRSTKSSSTSQGLIVLDVTSDTKAEVPTVTDTVVTLADRSQLSSGIDVVSGKVVWSSGDVNGLTLSVWGSSASKYHVSGNRISGPFADHGALVPFTLTGKDFAGRKAVAHGFLRIPSLDDMPVTLRSDLSPYKVDEDSSVAMHVDRSVAIGANDSLQVRDASGLPVQRANASCSATGDVATYRAGRDAPWTDTCAVQVRVAGQTNWSTVPIPIDVEPKAPQATLSPLSRTVAPGETSTINLFDDMTGWEGGRVGDTSSLDYHVSYSGSDFIVTQKGRTVTVEAKADATAGAVEDAHVSVSAYGGLTADIALRVGIAAQDTPRGATFNETCKVSSGSGCSTTVIGHTGEYDPFKGKPGGGLKLSGIGQVSCSVADIAVSGNAITASWASGSKPSGGTCVVPYTVVDAQGRTGPGTLTIDIQGYPPTPSSLSATGYTGSSVTLTVTLGDAANAHPSLSGVRIYEDGKATGASCSAGALGTYTCTVSGLTNGQKHSFTARAVNSVGESGDTSSVSTWAYQAPHVQSISAAAVTPASRGNGTAKITLVAGSDVAAFQLSSSSGASQTVQRSGNETTLQWSLPVGDNTITATPVSQFEPPTGSGGNTGQSASTTVRVAGTPYITANGTLDAVSNTSLRLDGVAWDSNWSSKGTKVLYAVWKYGQSTPSCTADANGNPVLSGGQSGTTFDNLDEFTQYAAMACVGNGYGVAASQVQTSYTWTTSPAVPSGNYTYTIGKNPDTTNTGDYVTKQAWTSVTGPSVPAPPSDQFQTVYESAAGKRSTSFSDLISSDQVPGTITVQYCWQGSTSCGASQTVTPTGAPTTASVEVASDATTSPNVGDLSFSGSITAPTSTTDTTGASSDVQVTITTDTTKNVITYSLKFIGSYADFGTVTLTRPYDPGS